jgi:hypothetical protein
VPFKSLVGSRAVEENDVFVQNAAQVAQVKDQHMIQALAP